MPSGRQSLVAEGPFPWSGSSVRLMSSTPSEFRRSLVNAFGAAVTADDDGLLVEDENASLYFALSHQKPQRIGALQLCALRVEITVRRGDQAAASGLLARIDRATQRGGG